MLDQSVSSVIAASWETGLPYNDFRNWDRQSKLFGLSAENLFFQYAACKKNTDFNIQIMGTSILILDKNLALDIFGFTPKYLNYNSSIGIQDNKFFKPVSQTTTEIEWEW